jgi:hypothetical protein
MVHSSIHANESPEPPLSYPGATPDAERAQKPALPEPPYEPMRRSRCLSLCMSLTRACKSIGQSKKPHEVVKFIHAARLFRSCVPTIENPRKELQY